MKPKLLKEEEYSKFKAIYSKLSGLEIPLEYMENSKVYGYYINGILSGGYILSKIKLLRTIELFACESNKSFLYEMLNEHKGTIEVTCYWLNRTIRKSFFLRAQAWYNLSRTISLEADKLVLYGTNKYGLAKLYSYPVTSTLLHQDRVNGTTTYIFIAEKQAFKKIHQIILIGIFSKFRKKDIKIAPKFNILNKIFQIQLS